MPPRHHCCNDLFATNGIYELEVLHVICEFLIIHNTSVIYFSFISNQIVNIKFRNKMSLIIYKNRFRI